MTIRTLVDAERYLDGFLNLERQASFDYEELGLGHIQALLGEIGHPEAKLPAIHVTGSKGKGSTSLAAEALLFQSWPLAAWLAVFFTANATYFPLSEEPGLARRFGDDYARYKAHVPRWLPRPKPWRQS